MTVPLPENRSQSTLQAPSARAALPGSRKAGCPRPPAQAAPRPCALSWGKVAARLCLIDGGGEPEANATDKLLRPQFVSSVPSLFTRLIGLQKKIKISNKHPVQDRNNTAPLSERRRLQAGCKRVQRRSPRKGPIQGRGVWPAPRNGSERRQNYSYVKRN